MKYEKPEIDVFLIQAEDVLALSGGGTGTGGNVNPEEVF